jgi:predicted nucleic acid-binding protein
MIFTCTDACCAINLINGCIIDVIAQLAQVKLCMQGLVEDEIGASCFAEIARLAAAGRFDLVSGDTILASEVGAIAERYNIGLGESECIVIGKKYDCQFASDDRKARSAAAVELGRERVIGSIGLLKSSVVEGLISPIQAFASYRKMLDGGAFLPRIDQKFFRE